MTEIQNLVDLAPVEDLDQIIQNNQRVILYFHATWCRPCRPMGELIAEIASEYQTVHIVRINVDTNSAVCREYAINNVPIAIGISSERKFYLSGRDEISTIRKILSREWDL